MTTNTVVYQPERLLRYLETGLFLGMASALSIANTLTNRPTTWLTYCQSVLTVSVLLLPVLVFSGYKPHWKRQLPRRRYLQRWLACFAFYLPLSTAVFVYFAPFGLPDSLFILAAFYALLLELLLESAAYLQKQLRRVQWLQKFGLEEALIISVTLISVTLAAMAVSSLGNPLYDTKEQLLIAFTLDLGKLFHHFGTFLSYALQFLLMYLSGYLFFYLNSHFLVSHVLKQKGLVFYGLSVLATIALLYPLIAQALLLLPINERLGGFFSSNPFQLENAFAALAVMLVSLPVVLALQWFNQNARIVSLEKEKTEAELDLLKQQLNPHFFFNTLNNLYALSLQKSERAPESILKLAELMRYVIYKGRERQVTIRQEIDYIEGYLYLQQLRLQRRADVRFEQEITDDQLPVAPLLLIVLVENAFKHGIEPAQDAAFLHLLVRSDARQLYIRCENSFEPPEKSQTGIGLQNLQRRLALLYPGKHTLIITATDQRFTAELTLLCS
ncbi:sensor histidine kinase [Larkinella sp. GY13]|uniref:sensor histidine kinase n=1 Tax=Larkinella sp. GY13 TaxID=3453720 RepID=UPI003EE9AB74